MLLEIKNSTNIPLTVKGDTLLPEASMQMYTSKVGFVEAKYDSGKCLIHYDTYNRLNFYEEGDIKAVSVHDATHPNMVIWILRPSYEQEKQEAQREQAMKSKMIEKVEEPEPIIEETVEAESKEIPDESEETILEDQLTADPAKLEIHHTTKGAKIAAGVVASMIPLLTVLIAVGVILDIPAITFTALACIAVPVVVVLMYMLITTVYRLTLEFLSKSKTK